MNDFVRPYGLIGRTGASSSIGTASGAPYTVADDENTMRCTSCAFITRNSVLVPPTLLS
jgi:hypothetical protein